MRIFELLAPLGLLVAGIFVLQADTSPVPPDRSMTHYSGNRVDNVIIGEVVGTHAVRWKPPLYEDFKLLADDGEEDDHFGVSVAVSGDIALIGANGDDDNGIESGSAYVYRYDSGTETWTKEDELQASDGGWEDYLGTSVSISGEVALVGAYGDDDNGMDSGSAYVFRYDAGTEEWVEEDKLLPSDGAENDYFGFSVSVSGDVALVGAWWDDDNGPDAGSAYVFRFDPETGEWVEEEKLLASDGAGQDHFGISVSISGDVALVGADGDDDNGNVSGSAYLFRYDPGTMTWVEEEKLLASDGAPYDDFGYSVSISGDVALIGAYGDDDNGDQSGSAYVFRYDSISETWSEEEKLLAGDSEGDDFFGISVSISNDLALVGADGDDDNGSQSGSAYMFRYDPDNQDWVGKEKLLASDGDEFDFFSISVSASGDIALIGAQGDDDNGGQSGSAYVYHFEDK